MAAQSAVSPPAGIHSPPVSLASTCFLPLYDTNSE